MSWSKACAVAMKQTFASELGQCAAASRNACRLLPARAPPRRRISGGLVSSIWAISLLSAKKRQPDPPGELREACPALDHFFLSAATPAQSVDSLSEQGSRVVGAALPS